MKLTIEFSKDEILNLQEGADAEYPQLSDAGSH